MASGFGWLILWLVTVICMCPASINVLVLAAAVFVRNVHEELFYFGKT